MRGQLLVSLVDDDGFGGDYLNVYTNSVLRKRIYVNSNNLYSCPIYVGDVVTLEFINLSPFVFRFLYLDRRDYTTDDVEGDNGVKNTNIATDVLLTTYTFTATTVNTAYDFEYIMRNDNVVQFQILTEASNPIMTENNDYINQQY
jgi:hypothetical protein